MGQRGVESRGAIYCDLTKSKEFQGDFACYKKRLMIELDGSQHQEEKNIRKDSDRENYLESQGVRVLLFWNHEIFKQKKDVLEATFYPSLSHQASACWACLSLKGRDDSSG